MGELMRESKRFRPALNDKLENRTVPSHLFGRFVPSEVLTFNGGFGSRGRRDGAGGFRLDGGPGLGGGSGLDLRGRDLGGVNRPGSVGASASTLKQDARLV